MSSKILLILEGEREEPRIWGRTGNGLLSLVGGKYEFVPFPYGGSLYELYEAYLQGEYDDIVSFLVETKGLILPEGKIPKTAYSSIYLIFDFDPHYQKYSDKQIRELLNHFDDETGNGKLYINYPMIESFYHLKSLPDSEYLTSTVSLKDFSGKSYKALVNRESCMKRNSITNKQRCYIIMQNYNKALLLSGKDFGEVNYQEILERQIRQKNEKSEVYVLCTFPLMVVDYNFEEAMRILELKIKDNLMIHEEIKSEYE